MPIGAYLILAAAVFSIGLVGVMLRRNLIVLFMSIELMLNAVNLTLVAGSRMWGDADGLVFTENTAELERAAAVAATLDGLLGPDQDASRRVCMGRLGFGPAPASRSIRPPLEALLAGTEADAAG